MTAIDSSSFYADSGYWELVETTMVELFKVSPHQARELTLQQLRTVAKLPVAERLLQFNVEPLYVAADLSAVGSGDCVEEHHQRYAVLRHGFETPRRSSPV